MSRLSETQWIMNELVTSLEFLHFLVKNNKSFVRLILYHTLVNDHKKHRQLLESLAQLKKKSSIFLLIFFFKTHSPRPQSAPGSKW